MRHPILLIALAVASWGSNVARAQVVQLPTFHYFTVSTSVLVPDRGSAYLGGVHRARFGSSTTGVPGLANLPGAGRLFKNRGIGSEVGTTGAHVSATILDLDAMDRAVLAEAAARRGETLSDPAIAKKAAFIARNIARNGTSASDNLRRESGTRTAVSGRVSYPDPALEARQAFEIAKQAEAKGHEATARINYQRVVLLTDGPLRAAAQSRLDALTKPVSPPRTRGSP